MNPDPGTAADFLVEITMDKPKAFFEPFTEATAQ